MIILDTSVLINILKDPHKAKKIIENLPDDDIGMSIVTLAELELGFSYLPTDGNQKQKKIFLSLIKDQEIRIIPFEEKIAYEYASVQAKLLKKGIPLSRFDAVVAATSLITGSTLITSDEDFKRVEGLKLLVP